MLKKGHILAISIIVISLATIPSTFADEMRLYENSDFEFSIKYPSHFLVDDTQDDFWDFKVKTYDKPNWATDYSSVQVFMSTLDKPLSQIKNDEEAISYFEKTIKELCQTSSMSVDGFICFDHKTLGSQIIEINGRKAYQIGTSEEWLAKDANTSVVKFQLFTVIEEENNLWQIYHTFPLNKFEDLADDMMSSIKSIQIGKPEPSLSIFDIEILPDLTVAELFYYRANDLTYRISSDSMEPALKTNDVILVDKVPFDSIIVGDIIVYKKPTNEEKIIVHRVVSQISDNPLSFRTKGDSNPTSIPGTDFPILEKFFIGKVGKKIIVEDVDTINTKSNEDEDGFIEKSSTPTVSKTSEESDVLEDESENLIPSSEQPLENVEEVSSLLERGNSLFDQGNYEDSVVFYDQVLEIDSDNIEANTGKNLALEKIQSAVETDSDSGGGCLIATATYGSELSPQVQQLRELRDNTLLQTQSGSAFMTGFNEFYYSFSPAVADYERQNPVFKEAVKLAITPLITSLSLLNYVDIDSEAEVLGYGISLILLNVGMYFVAPVGIVVLIRRKNSENS